MQRLITRLRRKAGDEHGAAAVTLALLLVPMLGFAAIAVDVGALYAERARLQVAADAAAIAVAQDCSRGNCGDMLATAQALITANDGDGTAAHPELSNDPVSVTVTGSTPKEHWFAPVIGFESTAVRASATVGWGSPSRGTALLPLAFSWCSFKKQTGGGIPSTDALQTILLSKTADAPECVGPSGLNIPGGFGYLMTDPDTCEVTSAMDQWMYSDTGNGPPSSCAAADFSAFIGKTVLMPIYDEVDGQGTSGRYRVYGYAAFHLTGYHLVPGQFSTQSKLCGQGQGSNDKRCVTGYFTRFVELSDDWDYDPTAPELGSSVLRLIA
jgi:Flp pilus assembly protein TadG